MLKLFNKWNDKFNFIKEKVKGILSIVTEFIKSKKVKILNNANNLKNKFKKCIEEKKKKDVRRKNIKKQKYTSLAPVDNIKDNATVDMLKKALNDAKNKNVALSGKYGAGKSSIVLSVLKKEKKFKPLYVSLGMLGIKASLNQKDEADEIDEVKEENFINPTNGEDYITEKNVEVISRTIEKSIIQQIIYKKTSNKFPASKIQRIPYVNKIIVFFITLGVAFYKFEIVKKIITDFLNIIIEFENKIFSCFSELFIVKKIMEVFSENDYIDEIIKLICLLVIIYYLSKYVVNFARKYALKNIRIMFSEVNEIEIGNSEESLINKYMDELVYFFEMTDYNLLVIEDLDRFLENDKLRAKVLVIFQKLKELNQILNTTEQLHGRKISFLYVIRDDLFYDEEERTKFFDIIVPKIPEISNYNSYARLCNVFKETEISNKFLQELSVYIKDYRVIKNLKNEFDLYDKEITGEGINKEKLLSMIALKNLRPKNYEELIKEQGILFNFLKNKKQLYQLQEDKIKENIKTTRNEILILEKEKIKDFEDLKYLALGNLACLDASTRGGANVISKSEFLNESFDLGTIENNIINIKNYDGYYFSEAVLFKSFGGKQEFIKRAQYVEKNNSEEIKKMKEKIKQWENQIDSLKKLSISELLQVEAPEDIKKLDEFELMMLKNGYIDENYKNYCFKYEETDEITRNDFSYILNVRQGNKSNYDFKIDKPQNVINELDELFFEKQVIWNYKILDILIEEKEKNLNKLSKFVNTLLKIDENTYDFIVGYISCSKNKNEFLKLLYFEKKEVIDEIFQYGVQNGNDEDELVQLLLNIPEILTEKNLNECIVKYIIERVDSDIWFELNEKVKESLILLDIKFPEIVNDQNNYELLDFIYNNNLYELNYEMIKSIFIYLGFKETDFEQKCLSLILKSDTLKKLKDYVLDNKEQFIRKCFVNTNAISNNIEDIIECLNTWDVIDEVKELIVTKIHENIDDISKVKDTSMYISILINEKIQISWENIYKIYCVNEEITKEIVEYIEKNIDVLASKKILFTVSKDEIVRYVGFKINIARNNNIDFKVYKRLLGKLNVTIDSIEENEIENDRLEILIKKKILKMNANNFNIIKNQKIEFLDEFVRLNIDSFVKDIDEMELDIESVERIIIFDKIKPRYKEIILSKIGVELLSIKAIEYIIDNYKSDGIRNISEEMKIYFLTSNICIESKISLINEELEMDLQDIIKIKEYIEYLPEEYSKIGNNDYHQISIPKTKLNEELVKRLEGKLNISGKPRTNKIVIYNKNKS